MTDNYRPSQVYTRIGGTLLKFDSDVRIEDGKVVFRVWHGPPVAAQPQMTNMIVFEANI